MLLVSEVHSLNQTAFRQSQQYGQSFCSAKMDPRQNKCLSALLNKTICSSYKKEQNAIPRKIPKPPQQEMSKSSPSL